MLQSLSVGTAGVSESFRHLYCMSRPFFLQMVIVYIVIFLLCIIQHQKSILPPRQDAE